MQTKVESTIDSFPVTKKGWATLPSATCHVRLVGAGARASKGKLIFQASDVAFSHLNNLSRELI